MRIPCRYLLACVVVFPSFCFAAPSASELNQAAGIPLFATVSLWDENVGAVADRLGLPSESATKTEESFRKYPDESARIFGAQPYSVALYGIEGKPVRLSIMFVNRGDYGSLSKLNEAIEAAKGSDKSALKAEFRARVAGYPAAFRKDQMLVVDALTKSLGPGILFRGGDERSERGLQWELTGTTIQLAASGDDYLALRILKSDLLNADKIKIRDSAMKKILKDRVTEELNGDVVIADIPMVDQGPKGFCVPATMERVLRFMGIPADFYIIARSSQSDSVKGTSIEETLDVVSRIAQANGRKLSKIPAESRASSLKKYLDDGTPIIWSLHVDDELSKAITDRSVQREKLGKDSDAWEKLLETWRKNAPKPKRERENGHLCLIVGYNEKTKEIAVSDSYGPEFERRWFTEDEIEAMSAKGMFVLSY